MDVEFRCCGRIDLSALHIRLLGVAELNTLPVDRITEIRVLDPFFYQPA